MRFSSLVDRGNLADLELNVESAEEPTTGTYMITPMTGAVAVSFGEGGAPMIGGNSSPFVTATFGRTDASCTTTEYDAASSGSVTLTTVSSTELAGSFDLAFSGGDHLTGSFDARVCTIPSGPTATTCGG